MWFASLRAVSRMREKAVCRKAVHSAGLVNVEKLSAVGSHGAGSAVTGPGFFCKRLGAGKGIPHDLGSDRPARLRRQEAALSARVSQDGVPILDAAKRRRCV